MVKIDINLENCSIKLSKTYRAVNILKMGQVNV